MERWASVYHRIVGLNDIWYESAFSNTKSQMQIKLNRKCLYTN